MDKLEKMGVLYVVAHLIITLAIILGYLYNPDETLKMGMFVVIGYWFGAINKDAIQSMSKTKGGK